MIAMYFVGCMIAVTFASAAASEPAPSDLRSPAIPVRRQRKKSVKHPAANLDADAEIADVHARAGYSRNCIPQGSSFQNLSNWKPGPLIAKAGKNATRWVALPQPNLTIHKRPKLVILMLAGSAINNEYIWQNGWARPRQQIRTLPSTST